MSVYKATSWGRTRRPKPPKGLSDKDTITGSATLAKLNALTLAQFGPNVGAYQTENQRYAHIMCSGSTEVSKMYSYTYASNVWHEIVTGSAGAPYGPVIVLANEHRIIDINGADFVAITSGSGIQTVHMAFSTF